MTVPTRTFDGATPVIVNAAGTGGAGRARGRRNAVRRGRGRGGRNRRRRLQVVENDVDRQDLGQGRHRPVPVHPRVDDGLDGRVASTAVGLRRANRIDLGLDGRQPRLVARERRLLAVHDGPLVHVEAGQKKSKRRGDSAADLQCLLAGKVAPDAGESLFRDLASAGRRLTACISAQLPDRSRLRAMRGRRDVRTSADASTAASGSATRIRARTRRSSSSTRPGIRVVPPVTRISAIACEPGCPW